MIPIQVSPEDLKEFLRIHHPDAYQALFEDQEEEEEVADVEVPTQVTEEMVESAIRSEAYFTAYDGAVGAVGSQVASIMADDSLKTLTFCVLTLLNGYTVTGESNCVDPDSFDMDHGRRLARKNAIAKVWPLLGYSLRDLQHLRTHND